MFINISGRLMLINASIIIKRRKNKHIRIESMTAFVFISGIHRTNGSDNEQLFGKSHSLFAAPKAKPSPSQGKAGMRGVFFFVIRHSFTIEDLVSAPNLKLGCAVILRGCASDYK